MLQRTFVDAFSAADQHLLSTRAAGAAAGAAASDDVDGAVVVTALVVGNTVWLANAGDCRLLHPSDWVNRHGRLRRHTDPLQ